ncbi:MAG TPA: DUF2750 domain-containing protein [Verrucomicrobiae bacterium]
MTQDNDDAHQASYDRFIQQTITRGEAWLLSSPAGTGVCESEQFEDTDVILFFSHVADARQVQAKMFPDQKPEKVALFDLLFRWLPGMEKDDVLAGPNWTDELIGLEMEPGELREELLDNLTPKQEADFTARLRPQKKRP